MPSSISSRRALSNRSTHFRNRRGGVDLGIQDASDMFVFLVVRKECLPVIESLLVSPRRYIRQHQGTCLHLCFAESTKIRS
jgi:hypothetical protein